MTCDQLQPLLETFADGEPGWGTAWRIRRHLAGCQACTKELAELRHLTARVRAWRDVPPPAHLQSRLAAALPSVLPPSMPRRPVLARRAALGLAGVSAAAAVLFWLLPGQPSIAFADVERAMQQVQTASYDLNSQVYDPQGRPSSGEMTISLHLWLRRSPAAIACINQGMSERTLSDKRGELEYSLKDGRYLKVPLKANVAQQVDTLLRQLMAPVMNAPSPAPGSSQQWTATPWQQRKATFNGIPCQKFMRTIFRTIGQRHGATNIKIWVDARNLRVLHVENFSDVLWMAEGYQERTVIDNFHYNETPPPGVFDWSPPPGAKVEGDW